MKYETQIQSLYEQKVIKEYQLAFDIAVCLANHQDGFVLSITHQPHWAVELIRRTALPICFYDTGAFDLNAFITQAGDWTPTSLDIYPTSGQEKFESLIWIAPEKDQLNSLIQAIQNLTQPSARLHVITPGHLNRFLPGNKRLISHTGTLATSADVSRSLKQTGWEQQTRCGLHSIRVILHSLAARCAARFDRPDWQDRLIFTSHIFYRQQGPLAHLSTVMITSFRKV